MKLLCWPKEGDRKEHIQYGVIYAGKADSWRGRADEPRLRTYRLPIGLI